MFGRFPTGVTALCAMDQDNPVGMTASAFVAVSLNPPLVSVCIKQGSWTWRRLRMREHWLECSVETEIEAGDHDIVLFRLHRAAAVDGIMPLVFHSSDFHTLAPIGSVS
ncbi:flavin reductase family protein [Brevundimonas faecalis]